MAKKISKQKRNYFINISLIITICGLVLYFSLRNEFDEIVGYLRNANIWYILVIFGLTVVSYLLIALSLTIFARLYTNKYKVHQAFSNVMIGTFYNSITPSNSGGQFVQAYVFDKQGVKISNAASILVMQFIVQQSALVIFGLVALLANFNTLITKFGTINIYGIPFNPISLAIIGFCLNAAVIVGLLAMSYSVKFQNFIINRVIRFLAKIKIIRKPEEKILSLTAQVENFRIELRRMQSNIPVTILNVILLSLRYLVLYSIPYFCGKALNAQINGSWLDSVFNAAYLQMITNLIPTPGAAGGSEYFYLIIFKGFFGSAVDGASPTAIANATNLLWRSFTFYSGLVIGALFAAFYKSTPKTIEFKSDRKTFVDLQISTYAERKESSETMYRTTQLSRKEIENRLRNLRKDLFGEKKKKNKVDRPQKIEEKEDKPINLMDNKEEK